MASILIVDDMAIFRDPIAACLRQAGFTTHCASDGKHALAIIRSSRPDLLLLDVGMPGMDGLKLLKIIRSEPAIAMLPVVLLTAKAEKDDVSRAAELGVQGYLLKSQFSVTRLLGFIRKALSAGDETGPAQQE